MLISFRYYKKISLNIIICASLIDTFLQALTNCKTKIQILQKFRCFVRLSLSRTLNSLLSLSQTNSLVPCELKRVNCSFCAPQIEAGPCRRTTGRGANFLYVIRLPSFIVYPQLSITLVNQLPSDRRMRP